jgi:hypothetical protein
VAVVHKHWQQFELQGRQTKQRPATGVVLPAAAATDQSMAEQRARCQRKSAAKTKVIEGDELTLCVGHRDAAAFDVDPDQCAGGQILRVDNIDKPALAGGILSQVAWLSHLLLSLTTTRCRRLTATIDQFLSSVFTLLDIPTVQVAKLWDTP